VRSRCALAALYKGRLAAHSAAFSVLGLYRAPARLASSVCSEQALRIAVFLLLLNTELSTVAGLFAASRFVCDVLYTAAIMMKIVRLVIWILAVLAILGHADAFMVSDSSCICLTSSTAGLW
jgi:hypothetical protein